METTYYTLTAREIIVTGDAVARANVSGGAPARQLVCVRQPRSTRQKADNVVDLAAWKAAREEVRYAEDDWYDEPDEVGEIFRPAAEYAAPAPRPRRDHKNTVLLGGEMLATLSVVGAMVILMARLLLF